MNVNSYINTSSLKIGHFRTKWQKTLPTLPASKHPPGSGHPASLQCLLLVPIRNVIGFNKKEQNQQKGRFKICKEYTWDWYWYCFQRIHQRTWLGILHLWQHPINNKEKEQYLYSSWWWRTFHQSSHQTRDWNQKLCQHGHYFSVHAKVILLQHWSYQKIGKKDYQFFSIPKSAVTPNPSLRNLNWRRSKYILCNPWGPNPL